MPPRKKKPAAGSVGLDAAACAADASPAVPAAISQLAARIEADGGAVLARYREPFGGHWVLFSALPIDKVAPTPYQRELSKTHADRLAGVIPKVGRFLDPVIAVPSDEDDKARYITPNGMHRLSALRSLGARAVTALVLPEPEIAFRILALNTEKAHNLRDKALEAIRMARALSEDPVAGKKTELDYAFELEQPAYLTIGICYEQNGRFSGGAYLSIVSRCDEFADAPIAKTLARREKAAARLMELDEAVNAAVVRLKEAGFTSMYLKPVVVARINPLRFQRAAKPGQKAPRADLDKTIDKMIEGARKLDASKIKPADLAAAAAMSAGGSAEE